MNPTELEPDVRYNQRIHCGSELGDVASLVPVATECDFSLCVILGSGTTLHFFFSMCYQVVQSDSITIAQRARTTFAPSLTTIWPTTGRLQCINHLLFLLVLMVDAFAVLCAAYGA